MANRELVVLGTASQSPTRRRNHNGYFLRWDGSGLLFDPGEGTQRQMLFAGVTAHHLTHICVTHFHGDHCLGLPGVLQRMALDQVPGPVEVCYPGVNEDVYQRLRHAGIFHDTLRLAERPVSADGVISATEAFTLSARALSHLVPTFGYRLAEPDGRRMLPEELVSRGIAGPEIGELQRTGSVRGVRLDEVSEPRPGQRFAFIMDTRLCDAAFELAQDCDLLVCESTFATEHQRLAREYGHLTAAEAGRIAAESGARSLVLTHFSQRYGEGEARLLDEAASEFGGEISLVSDLDVVPVPGRRS